MLLAILATAAAVTAPPVETRKGFPHRNWGDPVTMAVPVELAQTCFVESLMAVGRVTPVSVSGGADVYFAFMSLGSAKPYIRFMLRPRENKTEVTALYRHPVRRETVSGFVADIQAQCEAVARNQGLGGAQ